MFVDKDEMRHSRSTVRNRKDSVKYFRIAYQLMHVNHVYVAEIR